MPEPSAVGRSGKPILTAGRLLCAVPLLYLAGVVGYALFNFSDFAGAVPQFVRYVAAPLALAGVLVWAMTARDGARAATIGAYGCAILAALFLNEAVATSKITRSVATNADRLYGENGAGAPYRNSPPPGATARTIAARVDNPTLDMAVLGAMPLRDTLLCTGDDDNMIAYRADRFGFNNPDDIYGAGSLDIAIFGDSFIEGMCLKPGEDVGSRVRATIPKTAALGFRGAGPLIELAALGRFGPVLRPRLSVIVYFAGNDWENLEMELRTPWLRAALDQNASFGDAVVSPAQIDKIDGVIASLWQDDDEGLARYRARVLRNFVALSQTWAALGLHYPAAPKAQPEFGTIVARMRDIAATWGGEVLLIYLPRVERFRGGLNNEFVFDQARQPFFSAVSAQRVPAIDLTAAFESDPDPLGFYAEDGHFSPKGAAYLADLIIDYADDRFDDAEAPEIAEADDEEKL
jgi:hypothetical protein